MPSAHTYKKQRWSLLIHQPPAGGSSLSLSVTLCLSLFRCLSVSVSLSLCPPLSVPLSLTRSVIIICLWYCVYLRLYYNKDWLLDRFNGPNATILEY